MLRSKVEPRYQPVLLLGRQPALLSDVLAERFRADLGIELRSELAVGGVVMTGSRRRWLEVAAAFSGCHNGSPLLGRPHDGTTAVHRRPSRDPRRRSPAAVALV